MDITNIYTNKILKYPLTNNEYNNIDKVWNFLLLFKNKYIYLKDYRKYIIKTIKKQYTVDEFYLYETITNKLFWNLRWMIYPLYMYHNMSNKEYIKFIKNNYDDKSHIPHSILQCKVQKYIDNEDMDNKLFNNDTYINSTYYNSFINKLIIVDKVKKIIISKQLEGSSNIFSKNYFNLLTMTILFNRKLYEHIMKSPYKLISKHFIDRLLDHTHYYQLDYGFPNLNMCVYTFGTKEDRINRIKKMYYRKTPTKYWKKLI